MLFKSDIFLYFSGVNRMRTFVEVTETITTWQTIIYNCQSTNGFHRYLKVHIQKNRREIWTKNNTSKKITPSETPTNFFPLSENVIFININGLLDSYYPSVFFYQDFLCVMKIRNVKPSSLINFFLFPFKGIITQFRILYIWAYLRLH